MATTNAYSQYLDNQVMTATPSKLLILTYDLAIRFCRAAKQSMQERDLYEQNTNIQKVQNILIELMSSLNHDANPKLASNLSAIYMYCFNKLSEANIYDKQEILDEVLQILTDMRTTWAETESLARDKRQAA